MINSNRHTLLCIVVVGVGHGQRHQLHPPAAPANRGIERMTQSVERARQDCTAAAVGQGSRMAAAAAAASTTACALKQAQQQNRWRPTCSGTRQTSRRRQTRSRSCPAREWFMHRALQGSCKLLANGLGHAACGSRCRYRCSTEDANSRQSASKQQPALLARKNLEMPGRATVSRSK